MCFADTCFCALRIHSMITVQDVLFVVSGISECTEGYPCQSLSGLCDTVRVGEIRYLEDRDGFSSRRNCCMILSMSFLTVHISLL